MPRDFNTAGPCKPDLNYMLSPLERLPTIRGLIEQQKYFLLHAPRQTGKSTALLALADDLNREGRFISALLDLKVGGVFSHDIGAAELAILAGWRQDALASLPPVLQPPPWPDEAPGGRLRAALAAWARHAPRPLVLFLDEVDSLRDEALLSVLDQLRAGYARRPGGFPWSVALVGMRNIRDYATGEGRLGTASPFNVITDALRLRDFSAGEVAALYAQHTADTGQVFTPDAIDRAFELTAGQPWLVNALGRQLVAVVAQGGRAITATDVDTARDVLIKRRDTHLDSLAARLAEPRVRRILEPILAGGELPELPDDDLRFIIDLGLVRQTDAGGLEIANPIYRQIIPLALMAVPSASLPQIAPTWLRPDGRIDADRLLDAFLDFWRRHGEPLMGSAPYHEIAPHLVLMAFMHRVVNGGGTIEREYAIGSRRMDLCLRHGPDLIGMELKVWRRTKDPDPLAEGLAQLDVYLNGLGAQIGWLVIFDRRPGVPEVAERTTTETVQSPARRMVKVIRA